MSYNRIQTLPRLPIPTLEETCKRYLTSLQPLLNNTDFATSTEAVKAFILPGGIGEKLQQRLKQRDSKELNSWLERWWFELAYHTWREPSLVNSNWFIVASDHPNTPKELLTEGHPARKNGHYTPWQIRRAAEAITSILDYKHLIDNELLPPEGNIRSGPMCMNQYKLMLSAHRIPKPKCDLLITSFPSPHRHIIVLLRDQIYSVDVIDEAGRVSISEVEKQLQMAIQDVLKAQLEPSICLLTSEHRDTWTRVHEWLEDLSPKNQYSFSIIETALFAICLDDYCLPITTDNLCKNAFHGMTGHNRWFDIACTICIMNDGRMGFNGEHSPCDALLPSNMFQYIRDHEPANNPVNIVTNPITLREPQKLRWEINSNISKAIETAHFNAKKIIENSDLHILRFTNFGSDYIKSKVKTSPDAFAQMAMQLAFYRMHNTITATYETVLTRKFKHGRTECCRSCSIESKAFVTMMDKTNYTAFEKSAALRKACDAHIEYTNAASNGKGVDRHLLGLRMLLLPGESSDIFDDPAYKKSQYFRLSTSGLFPGENLLGSGFGAACEDGYGINYMVAPKLIKFGIESKYSCKETSSTAFAEALEHALKSMAKLYESELKL